MVCLRVSELRMVPSAVQRDGRVVMHCLYELDGELLYCVKWYRGFYEFYRYCPSEKPAAKVFPRISVDVSMKYHHPNHPLAPLTIACIHWITRTVKLCMGWLCYDKQVVRIDFATFSRVLRSFGVTKVKMNHDTIRIFANFPFRAISFWDPTTFLLMLKASLQINHVIYFVSTRTKLYVLNYANPSFHTICLYQLSSLNWG